MRGNGRNHNFIILTRQKADELFNLSEQAVAAAASLNLGVRKVAGYGSVRILAFSDASFSIHVLQGPTAAGPFVETQTLTSVAGPGGQQIISTSIVPTGSYMQLILENTGGSSQSPVLQVLGQPV